MSLILERGCMQKMSDENKKDVKVQYCNDNNCLYDCHTGKKGMCTAQFTGLA